jgi:hypothetical protein
VFDPQLLKRGYAEAAKSIDPTVAATIAGAAGRVFLCTAALSATLIFCHCYLHKGWSPIPPQGVGQEKSSRPE